MEGLGKLYVTQLNLSSITWELFKNTEVNMVISSNIDLQESQSKYHSGY